MKVLDWTSERGELIDCFYQSMPEVAAKAAKRREYAEKMRDMWKRFKEEAPADKQGRARWFEANRPKWDKSWADPIGKAPKVPISERIDPERPFEKVKYLYDNFDDLDAETVKRALTCAANNEIEDFFIGHGFKAKGDLVKGKGAPRL